MIVENGSPRFIPAPAGNTGGVEQEPGGVAVHPRTCGEHLQIASLAHGYTGSSPHLRGTRQVFEAPCFLFRFIPAPAGNTTKRINHAAITAVHPRTSGEHGGAALKTGDVDGSSPHLRGTLPPPVSTSRRHRFIPAPAGNTPLRAAICRGCTVHPRTCGEHRNHIDDDNLGIGSSPHLRGTLNLNCGCPKKRRFIPAPAGNTFRLLPPWLYRPVHPRTCGEHAETEAEAATWAGSSPHLRGTLCRVLR